MCRKFQFTRDFPVPAFITSCCLCLALIIFNLLIALRYGAECFVLHNGELPSLNCSPLFVGVVKERLAGIKAKHEHRIIPQIIGRVGAVQRKMIVRAAQTWGIRGDGARGRLRRTI